MGLKKFFKKWSWAEKWTYLVNPGLIAHSIIRESRSVPWLFVHMKLFERHTVALLALIASSAPCKSFTQERPFCISEGCPPECASLGGVGMEWRERKGSFFNLPGWHGQLWSRGEHCFCTKQWVIWGLPMGCREGWQGASDPPCLPALHFIQRRAVTLFICLHIRFPQKSSFEAGLLGLSSVSTSICQQAGSVNAPTNADSDNTLNKNQMERFSVAFQ